ncbi:hypothetical protein B0H10DRAFT_2088790 [Mycena sp. CBHHK59/15]|nr:hypothetical protein B0H10DRAFT_2088790 [Mycena sp. CBHHK59/15]
MTTDLNLADTTSRPMISRPLKRGTACMNCRCANTLLKCDGQKPICGPCRKQPRDDECEYSDGPARSRTKALEDTVSRLDVRLHELEHPEDSPPAVPLHFPYLPYNSPPQLTIPSYVSLWSLPNSPYHQVPPSPSDSSPESQGFTPLSPFSPPSTMASSPPFGTHGHGSSPLGIFDSRHHSWASVATLESSRSSSLDSHVDVNSLIQTFLPHATDFGFFLDWNLLGQSTMQPMLRNRSPDRPSPALLNAVYMWGAHLAGDILTEDRFKYYALHCAATDLLHSHLHPHSFLHTLQAEVLLSHYFFRTGHFLEARSHTATAVALALGGGLHQIRSCIIPTEHENGLQLRAPADAIEEGERINAFWAVFMMQKNLAVALEPPARICGMLEAGGIQIDTPWPLELDEYKKASLTSNVQGDSTVRNYLSQQAPSYQERTSLIAMNVKACILLSQAVYLNGQHIPRGETQSWWAAFHAVDRLINALRSQLPDLAQIDDRTARTVLLTQSLLNAATIKVHSLYMREDQRSRHTCLAAACDMFRFGEKRLHGLGYLNHLNPMMGTLWLTACCVLVDEIKRPRPPSQTLSYDEKEGHASLLDGLATLKAFARGSPLMRHQLTKAQEAAS